jgi:hypothetical protein
VVRETVLVAVEVEVVVCVDVVVEVVVVGVLEVPVVAARAGGAAADPKTISTTAAATDARRDRVTMGGRGD